MGNSKFVKKDNHLITYQSGGCSSQVDYILLQCNKFHVVKNIKVILGEECITQHRLLICDLKPKISKNNEKKIVPKLRAWELKDPSMNETYVESSNDLLANHRIDNLITLMTYGNILKRVFFQPQKKFVVGQRRANGDSRHGGGIMPLMM